MNIHTVVSSSCLALLLAAGTALAVEPAGDQKPVTTGQGMPQGMGQGMGKGMHENMGKGMGMMSMHNPDSLKWSPAPPALPKGAQVAILDGDPFKPGPYVIRLKMPPGYKVPPHWHSRAENVTVIAGQLALGMGDTLDAKATQDLRPGGFHAIAAQVHHFAISRSGAIVQIHGEGPFDITYINPADNPEAAPKK